MKGGKVALVLVGTEVSVKCKLVPIMYCNVKIKLAVRPSIVQQCTYFRFTMRDLWHRQNGMSFNMYENRGAHVKISNFCCFCKFKKLGPKELLTSYSNSHLICQRRKICLKRGKEQLCSSICESHIFKQCNSS